VGVVNLCDSHEYEALCVRSHKQIVAGWFLKYNWHLVKTSDLIQVRPQSLSLIHSAAQN